MGTLLIYLFAEILGVFLDFLVFKNVILDHAGSILDKIIVTIFVMPVATLIIFGVLTFIASIIDRLIFGEYSSSGTSNYEPVKKKKSNDYWVVDHVTEARCENLLNLMNSLSGTAITNDLSIMNLVSQIRVNQYCDYYEANIVCDTLEYLLQTEYRTTVASIPEGYRYLRSVGVI